RTIFREPSLPTERCCPGFQYEPNNARRPDEKQLRECFTEATRVFGVRGRAVVVRARKRFQPRAVERRRARQANLQIRSRRPDPSKPDRKGDGYFKSPRLRSDFQQRVARVAWACAARRWR